MLRKCDRDLKIVVVMRGDDRDVRLRNYPSITGITSLYGVLVHSRIIEMIIPKIKLWPIRECKYFVQHLAYGVQRSTKWGDSDVLTIHWFGQISTYMGANLTRFWDRSVIKSLCVYNDFINFMNEENCQLNFYEHLDISCLFMRSFEQFYFVSGQFLSDFEMHNFIHQRCLALFADEASPYKILNQFVGALCESFFKLFAVSLDEDSIIAEVEEGIIREDWSECFESPILNENSDIIRFSVKNGFKCFIDIDSEGCLQSYLNENRMFDTYYGKLQEISDSVVIFN